jgi:2-dehydro-3-deoxygalactonokinase
MGSCQRGRGRQLPDLHDRRAVRLIARQSVLRHGMQGEGDDARPSIGAVADTLSRPERIGARLFSLRAEGLLTGLSPPPRAGPAVGPADRHGTGRRAALLAGPARRADRLSALVAAYSRALAAQGVQALIL